MSQRRNKLAVISIVIAAALYVGNLLIDNPYTHRLVNLYINEKFLSKLPISAEYQSMRVQLLPPAVHLMGVRISTKEEAGRLKEELLSTSQASLVISPWSLFLAKPQIGDLEIHDLAAAWPPPQYVLEALKKLEPQTPETLDNQPAQWPPKPSPPFASMQIHNASLRFTLAGIAINAEQDPKEETSIETKGAELDIDFNGWKDIKINAEIQKLDLYDRGSSYLENAKVTLSGGLRGDSFRSTQMRIESPRLKTEGTLRVDINTQGNTNVIDLITILTTQNSDIDFSLLGSFVDLSSTFGQISGHTKTQVDIPIAAKSKPALLVTGSAQSHGATLSGFNFYDSEVDFSIDMDAMTFQELRIKSGSNSFGKGKGKLSFNKALSYEFHAKPDKLPFDTLLGVFNVPFDVINFDLSSQDLALTGQGDPFQMNVTANAVLDQFRTPNIVYDHKKFPKSPTCELKLDLLINSKQIDYRGPGGRCGKDASTLAQGFPLVISGVTTFNDKQGMDLSLSSPNDFNPEPLSYFAQTHLQGSGKMHTRIYGPYSHVVVDSQIDTKDTVIGTAVVGALTAKTLVDGTGVHWSDVNISPSTGGTIASKSGSIAFDPQQTLDLDLSVADLDHAVVSSLISDIAGDANGMEMVVRRAQAKLSGPLMKPFLYKGDIDVSLESVRDNSNEFASSVVARIEATNTGFITKNAKVGLGTFESHVDASLTRSGTIDPKLLGGLGLSYEDKVSLEINAAPSSQKTDQLQRFPFIGAMAAESGVKGTLSGQAKLSGNLRKLSGLAKLKIDNSQILSIPAPSINSSIILDGAKLDIIAEQGGNALKGRMNLDLGTNGLPYKWYLTTRNFDARPILPNAFSSDARNFAYLTATWSMEGLLEKWWASTGELDLRSVRAKLHPSRDAGQPPFELASANPVVIKMTPNGWYIADKSKLSLNSGFGSLEVGLGETKPPQVLSVQLQGKLILESLKSLMPQLELATGQLQFSGGIFGSVSEPRMDLNINDMKITAETASTWQPVSIGFADFRPALKDISLQAQIRSNGIVIEKFSGTKGAGTIDAKGFFAFQGTKDTSTDLSIYLDSASFLYPFPVVKNFDSVLDGNIHITGQQLPLMAAGNIQVKRARSNRDIDIREAILDSIRSSGTKSGPETLQPTLAFDLTLNADESIGFNSRAVQAQLSSNLHLSGTDVTPEILGLIEVKKGKFFYKRDFVIQRGLINYDDPIKPDPSLDISATSDVGGYKVSIGITGKASEPAIDFSVDPPTRPDGTAISKLDIITLLSRGSLPESKIGGSSSAESTAAAEALNLLAGQVEDTVQKVFDLSGQNIIKQVYIDTYAGTDGTPIARFNLPLNIAEDLDLVLKVDQSTVKLSSEYTLRDSISLTGGIESSNEEANNGTKRQGNPADTGVDVKFRFAFP